ncbi:MAG: bifunctional UDP-N-acetylmuramoyl-tripeptide:D-alanyl-D-alanine ligase/alanine racemase [Bacteroidota bacterium]
MTKNQYSIKDIAGIIDADFIGDENYKINNLSIDSRKSGNNSKTLFFALETPNNDGHKYIDELILKGTLSFVVNKLPDNINKSANYIVVKNSFDALKNLARWKRENSNIKTVAITGSNGKTIVKEWLYQLLQNDFNIVRSPKSYNSQIGVPLSVWGINKENNLGIFEVGISKPGEMDVLQKIVKPQIGIFTNIGSAHSENFISRKQKIEEKIKLFKNAEKLIFKDDAELGMIIKNSDLLKNVKKLSWAFRTKADLQILGVLKGSSATTITGLFNAKVYTVEIPFTDEASVENAITSWLLMLDFGYDNDEIKKRIKKLTPIEMRLEQLEGNNNCTIINDGYSLDVDSLKIALDFLDTQFQHSERTVIISNIEQHKEDTGLLYEETGRLIEQHKINKVILVGSEISRYKNKFHAKYIHCFNSTADLVSGIDKTDLNNEVVLVKGARSFRFEKIVTLLAKKSHDTVLEVNLSGIVRNLNFYKSRLKAETKVMVMVKAFSYGGGSYEIANILQYHNVDYLAVAYADEGKALRESGISTPILVLNPEVSSYATLIEYNLEPEIYSLRVLNEFLKVLGDRNFSVHLKIDTGMHRLGFMENDIDLLTDTINRNKNIEVKSIFSHLSAADDLLETEFTESQANKLFSISKKISDAIKFKPLVHLLNSAGIINYPEYQFNMVRIGLGLHGITKNEEAQQFLEPITKLNTVISQIRTIEKGESVGYNREFTAKKTMKIATLPIGYADGIDRRWGNEIGGVVINNKRAAIIGIIAMDMMMVDVSDISCEEGDAVEIFGNNITVSEIAEKIGTIPYEILTKISPRVKRVYYQE